MIGHARRILGERPAKAGRGLGFDVSIRGWCVEKKTWMSDFDRLSALRGF